MDKERIQDIIYEVVRSYDLSDYEVFEGFVYNCIDRVNLDEIFEIALDDEAWETVDSEMIYYDDQWDLMRAWCEDPKTARLEPALEDLTMMVLDILERIHDEMLAEKKEELETKLCDIRHGIINLHNEVMQLQDNLDDVKIDDSFDDLVDYDEYQELEYQLDEIEAFLSEYDVINHCEEEVNVDDDFNDIDIDLEDTDND